VIISNAAFVVYSLLLRDSPCRGAWSASEESDFLLYARSAANEGGLCEDTAS